MNKKTKNIIGIAVFLLVWAMLISKLYNNSQVEDVIEEAETKFSSNSYSPLMFNKDTFDLELPDLDPFLKKTDRKRNRPTVSNANQQSTPIQTSHRKIDKNTQQETAKWPQVQYLGFVNNLSQNNPLCLIKINGRLVKMSKGKEEQDVRLTKVFRDSIYMVFGKEERTFKKG